MARSFNGSTDEAVAASIWGAGLTVTMSVWVNPTNATGTQAPMWSGNSNSSGYGLVHSSSGDGNFYAFVVGTSFFGGGTKIPLNLWSNIILTGDGSGNWHIYLNGTSAGSLSSFTGTTPSGQSLVGAAYNGAISSPFAGSCADAAVWNTVLSGANITSLLNGVRPVNVNSANLKAWYPLDGYASPETDLSGSGNNLTLTGTSRVLGPPALWRISG